MNDQHPHPMEQLTGQVQSMFYLVDEPTTMITILADGQIFTARALPRGATICATLRDAQLEGAQIVAFSILA